MEDLYSGVDWYRYVSFLIVSSVESWRFQHIGMFGEALTCLFSVRDRADDEPY